MEAEKREMATEVVAAELKMVRFNKRPTDWSILMGYFDTRRTAAQQMDDSLPTRTLTLKSMSARWVSIQYCQFILNLIRPCR